MYIMLVPVHASPSNSRLKGRLRSSKSIRQRCMYARKYSCYIQIYQVRLKWIWELCTSNNARGYMIYPFRLPIKYWGKELGDETLIIWAERLSIDRLIAFAVQVVWVERAYCGQRTLVLFISEVRVRALTVPSERNLNLAPWEGKSDWRFYLRVEAVIPDHGETFFWEGTLALEDVVEILRPGVNDPFGGFLTNDKN